jgi:hypothetical protein
LLAPGNTQLAGFFDAGQSKTFAGDVYLKASLAALLQRSGERPLNVQPVTRRAMNLRVAQARGRGLAVPAGRRDR